MTEQNPLQGHFRAPKIWITLPSGTDYYTNDVVEFNESGEVGIMPMTASDEVLTRNPDALLNGDALVRIIQSCVPAIKKPKEMLSNDIEAIMIGIRHASYGDDIDITVSCPECETENTYSINITNSLSNMEKLESEYTIGVEGGLTMYIRPFQYAETVNALKLQFEQYKTARAFSEKDISEDQRIKMFSDSFIKMAQTNIDMLCSCVLKIVMPNGDEVTNEKHIKEFLVNSDKRVLKSVDDMVKDINSVGVNKNFEAVCQKCEHSWETGIDYNPVNFFTES